MRLIIENIRLPYTASDEDAYAAALRRIKNISAIGAASDFHIHKKSVDARHRDNIRFVVSVICEAESNGQPDADQLSVNSVKIRAEHDLALPVGDEKMSDRPVIVGFGPCGMFAALILARAGFRPIVFERGGSVEKRAAAYSRFVEKQILDCETNVQFGAGGAGTFSDGKLTCRIGDSLCEYVLSELCAMGADESVMWQAKPHIGTDVLCRVVSAFHREITALGGEIHYDSKVCAINRASVSVNGGDVPFGVLVLATGHSARDTYAHLMEQGFEIIPKPFSAGVRIEHLQSDIDRAMYGDEALSEKLGHSSYQLSHRKGQRGVYSFCMCPGGVVTAAASEEGGVVTNGMSNFARDGRNSNAALAVSVLPEDYGALPSAAIDFQRRLEAKSFTAGGGDYYAPVQSVGSFCKRAGKIARVMPTYMNGRVREAELSSLLPPFITEMLRDGLYVFAKRIQGFSDDDIPLTGFETRTSAPVRIVRSDAMTAAGHGNIYPCGEGAGYAGGIVSAAVDGIKCAIKILEKYKS